MQERTEQEARAAYEAADHTLTEMTDQNSTPEERNEQRRKVRELQDEWHRLSK